VRRNFRAAQFFVRRDFRAPIYESAGAQKLGLREKSGA